MRERLQLLMLTSIVEASHLGAQADGILEISNTIKRLSGEWSALTQQSEEAMQEIRLLVEQSQATMEAFSGGAQEQLRGAREQTRAGLAILRDAARCAESRGQRMEEEAATLQGRVSGVRATGERLERCLARLAGVLTDIDAARSTRGERRDPSWLPDGILFRHGTAVWIDLYDGNGARSAAGGTQRRPVADGAARFRGQQRGAVLSMRAGEPWPESGRPFPVVTLESCRITNRSD